MKKKIFITGSNGFIGRNLVEQMSDEFNISYESHKSLDLLNSSDVENYFKKNKFNVIIHCAYSNVTKKDNDINYKNMMDDNIKMFINLSDYLDEKATMFVIGSGAEYSKINSMNKIQEEEFKKNIPQDPYGYSKYVIAKHIEKTENIINLRLFGVYGKYEEYAFRFISNSILKNILHLPITIYQNAIFDYLYIDDFIDIMKLLTDKKLKYKFYNVTPNESIDLISIANIINNQSDYKSELLILNSGFNKKYTGDNSRLINELGNFNFISYECGIKKLYDYYLKNINKIDVKSILSDVYLHNLSKD